MPVYEINGLMPVVDPSSFVHPTATLIGDHRSIRSFIHQIETAPDFLVLENVALSQGSEREQGLNVTVKVATYFRES